MTDPRGAPRLPLRWPDADARPAEAHTVGDARTREDPSVTTAAPDGDGRATPDGVTGTDAGGSPQVVVRTSSRRRKTASAYWERGHIVVVLPTHVPRARRAELVDWLVARIVAKRPGATESDESLFIRASALADRYVDGVRPSSIRWVTNQSKRWGSCSAQTGEIRLSHRLRAVPEWVLDATIVHELAHLVHADHSPAFHAIADRHPRQREALVFLEGYSLGLQTAG